MIEIPEDSRQLDSCVICGSDMYTESSFSICDDCKKEQEDNKETIIKDDE